MSQRVKRPNRSEDGSIPVKRRKRTAAEEEEAASLAAGTWQPRSNDLKSSIYNRTTTEAPAELFRKDLISAMKLPDSEPLASDEYWVIVDQWKQEWERGVQVPVNPDSLPEPSVTVTHCNSFKVRHDFKLRVVNLDNARYPQDERSSHGFLPKNKYIRITKDDNFKPEEHEFSTAPAQAEAACSYDLDECDVSWLKILNSERAMGGLGPIFEDQLERVIERFEECCWEKIQSILRNEEGLGIEYDENVICDVCRSPDSEEGNEMVFCDNCNICVHQACYGITQIPEGQWLCCTCNLRKRPECVLCPNKGGAMKCTRSGQKWAHVSCALWIPEVSIGCVEKMEPITKISSIPSSRWALICVLCRERVGACIQCSVKTCKTAYHVTCAFKHGLEMRAIIEDENADDGVKLRSYCEKHSKSSKKEKSICSGSEDDDSKRKKRKDMTSEEKNQARAARLQEIEAEFFKHVSVKDIVSIHLDVDNEGLQYIYNYWKLKRKAGHNKPLLPPKSEDVEFITHKREQADIEKMRMFVQLRQDLERVRNLCYMVSRREKLSRSFFRMREQTFHKQAQVLDSSNTLPTTVIQAVIEANHGPSIYDRLYSHNESEDHTSDFDTILARIAGMNSPAYSGDEKKHEVNGLFKDVKNNPYKKVYFNGSSKRRSGSLYGSGMSSSSSSDERTKVNKDKENRLHSSSEDEKPPVSSLSPRKKSTSPFKKNSTKTADRKKKQIPSRLKLESSSEEDAKPPKKDWGQFSKSRLSQVDRELGESASDSDELMPIRSNKKADNVKSMSSIYSDSDSSDLSAKNDDKSSNATNDSQSKLRTKAAVKQFSHKPSSSKSPNKSSPENKKKLKAEEGGKKETNSKKKDCVPSELIVPQRQAAKKATENLKSTTIARVKEQPSPSEETAKAEEKVEKPVKSPQKLNKPKPTKDNKEPPPKETKKESKSHGDVFDIEKELDKIDSQEILAYVPQRQAAKKAAEHIKSGMGKPVPAAEANVETDKPKKETEQPKVKKESDAKPIKKESEPEKPAKLPEHKRKSSSNSSSSSSSSTSTDSSSSSSTESDEEPAKPQPRSESPFSNPPRETTKRSNANDWPFLDKGSKPAASSSSSDSSDSSPPSSPRKSTPSPPTPPQPKAEPARAQEARQSTAKSHPKSPDKKQPAPAAKREEQPRGGRGRGRAARGRQRSSNAGDRVGDTNVGPGDLPDGKRVDVERERVPSRKGKQPAADDVVDRPEKEAAESSKLLSPVRKTDKKLRGAEETNVSSIEKEILERKAGKERSAKLKSTLDKLLFGAPDKKCDNSERRESEKSVIKTSHAAIPAKVEEKAASRVHSPEKQAKPAAESVPVKPPKPAEREKTSKVADKAKSESDRRSSLEKAIKSIERPLKEQEKPKMEKEPVSPKKSPVKKSPNKSKCLDDIFANKVHQSDAKENKIDFMPKQLKSTQDISIADKIIEDDLKLQKSKDILKPSVNVAVPQFPNFSEKIDANKLQDLIHQNHLSSPIHNAKDIDFDIDSFGDSKDEEIIKGLLPFSANIPIIRGDSKEDSARETLNLVEKLRMGLSKKSTSDAEEVQTLDIDKEPEMPVHISPPVQTRKIPESQLPTVNLAVNKPDNSQMVQDKMYEPNADYRYLSCSANDALVANKNIPIQETSQSLSDHSIPIQGDERWVPPSEPYPNVQSAEPSTYLSDSLPHIDQQYLLQHYTTNTEEHHKSQSALTHLPAQLDVRLQDEPLKNQSPPLHDRRISQTPLIDPASMDCMPSPFPYADIHPQAKWADSAVIPSRRSSSSSAASTSSTCSRKGDQEDDPKLKTDMLMGNQMQMDMNMPPYIEPFPSFSENPQFVSPVSLFHPPINTQIPLPSTGPAMYPPQFGAPFPTPHPIPPMPKPVEDNMPYSSTCTAAFTSSQHNMALTAAMLNLPTTTPKPADPPLEEVAGAATETICGPPESMGAEPVGALLQTAPAPAEVVPAPAQINATPTLPSPKSTASVGKKSPSKPTRTSARVTSQMNKSPNKSPGKSPRQEQAPKQGSGRGRGDSKRGSGKSGASRNNTTQSRGRGRGRGRGRSTHHDHDFMSNIHNKLVGTVYDLDFEDDISNDNMTDLKSMRERRKSVDVHERKYESSFISRHSPQLSPKFSSPSQSAHKSRSYNADLRDLRPPTPIENTQAKDALSNSTANETATPMFVQPVLPGPVDMRTYNSSFDQQSYNDNLLGAFASETTEAQVHDEIDEEFEKELHSALTAKKPEPPPPEISSVKVSLSDTRNQLKFKIKGPIANNYTATVAPLPTTPIVEPAVSNITPNAVANNVINSASASSGTSNLRRMRKKELLRQYWNQEVNQDDPNSNSNMSTVPATPTMNRTIITIPKAVASMTSIPTKEDYRDYQTDDMSDFKHHRKESKSRPGGLSRELKQLDLKHQYLSFDDDAASDRRRSLGSVGSNSGLSASFDSAMSNKRRGRPPRPSSQQVTPKLKIKISSNSIVDKVRPPKKRHSATIAMPSVEDLKRESMKFRKRVMADLKCEKVKKKKRDKGEKRKKRKLKPEVQIISSRNENPTKLIIRFGKKSSDGDGEKRTTNESGAAAAPPSRVKGDEAPGGGPASDNVRGSPPKVTPLKLKLSRCQEGSGYIMKPATSQCGSEATVEEAQAVQPGQPPPLGLPAQRAPPPLPLNEDCEVR